MSTNNAQARAAKSSGRSYRLGKRAEKQAETRQRIVEAAVALHCSVGPARTTVSDIAERAGVQRHTVYAHFPDEWSLLLACSGFALGRDPLPEPAQWATLPAGRERIRAGLEALYGWYARNDGQASCVLRDAEYHAPTREIVALRMAPTFDAAAETLGERLSGRQRALLGVALDFACWRVLARTMSPSEAAETMAEAIAGRGG